MSLAARAFRALTGIAVIGSVAVIGHADAATATTTKVYFHASNCPADDSWLDMVASKDSADGCGIAGGIPLEEAIGATALDFATKKTFKPFKIDASKKVTGVYAVGSWFGAGGAGQVTVDISLSAKTKAGKTISFGDYTGTVTGTPADLDHVNIPFSFAVPAAAKGQTFAKVTFSVAQHGANFGFDAYSFSGNSYANIPTLK
ncbi:MAG: hypothetical protein QOK42_2445 [Frankiaceae bacterium]|jgi:hypothetical protein|nr:hypothetical protein [Frankiaceae bacterium]MDX6273304.1 hypothetical protein [Frankiales bacterium]